MKHVLRRHFFVRDMVEEFEITVPFVRTADNLSDFLTKPFASAPAFFEARAIVMNERAAAARASAPSSDSIPRREATAVRGGASEGDSGAAAALRRPSTPAVGKERRDAKRAAEPRSV